MGQIEFDPLPKRHNARGIEKQVNICYRDVSMMNATVGVVWRREAEKTAYYERNPIPVPGREGGGFPGDLPPVAILPEGANSP